MVEEKIVTIHNVDYIVSTDGKVYSTKNYAKAKYHQEIKQRLNRDGYLQITVGKTGHRRAYRVHRMVAEAFIPNPDNLPEVNHKDCNRTNNNVENLEWCTHKYNVQYAIDCGNHICTKDITGNKNPNFGNHKLAEIYANNPEYAKEKCSRPGGQNGRARPIRMIDTWTNQISIHDCMSDCAKYLIDNQLVRGRNTHNISDKISAAATNGTLYFKRFKFEFVN